jgi:1,4-alpha-glucan branching enzyme
VSPATDFVLTLHSHLPYVLHHGRWPHGSDWLCEAVLDSYLPLLEALRGLARDGVAAPVTIGFTPVLTGQLASGDFRAEMEVFLTHRLLACDEATASLAANGDAALLPLVSFWRTRLLRLRRMFQEIEGDLVAAFRTLEAAGRVELIGSAATHGFLPLLARDESIRLQLAVGVAEHRRLFGRQPAGCWLPECGYRPRGPWQPVAGGPRAGLRRGIEEHLADAGFRYFFTDAHLAGAGRPLGVYGNPVDPILPAAAVNGGVGRGRSPYQPYRVVQGRGGDVSAYVRDPRTSMQVWSRHRGYPGDEWYLEFHRMRWPGGLKLWRVSDSQGDLGAKAPYDPAAAQERAAAHAGHFARMLEDLARGEAAGRGAVVVAPFDTELFGHWWFEGPDFLALVYRELARRQDAIRPATASRHLDEHPSRATIRLAPGSWGAHGDFSMWLGPATAWTWARLWPLEERFWDAAPGALGQSATRPVLAQAARGLLLAQSSDWQFVISTGAAADYAERRFREHCDAAEALVAALEPGAEAQLEAAQHRAEELRELDAVFPEILPAVAAALGGSRALAR